MTNPQKPIHIGGITVSIERRKVRYARLIVNALSSVRVVVPRNYPNSEIECFLQEKEPWIRKQLARFEQLRQAAPRVEEGCILFRGESYRFLHRPADSGTQIDAERKTISSNLDLLNPDDLNEWYMLEAKRLIPSRVRELASKGGFWFWRTSVRNQKSRWGSCSSLRKLSLNWRLILLPPRVMDYVIVHELVHTEIMNHGAKFWNRLESIIPDWKELRSYLDGMSSGMFDPARRTRPQDSSPIIA